MTVRAADWVGGHDVAVKLARNQKERPVDRCIELRAEMTSQVETI